MVVTRYIKANDPPSLFLNVTSFPPARASIFENKINCLMLARTKLEKEDTIKHEFKLEAIDRKNSIVKNKQWLQNCKESMEKCQFPKMKKYIFVNHRESNKTGSEHKSV